MSDGALSHGLLDTSVINLGDIDRDQLPDRLSISAITMRRAVDLLIAATALPHDLPIYTRNPDDFLHFDEVRIVPVGTT